MSHDTLLHRLVRPAVRHLAPTRVRPNHLTSIRIALALAAAASFAENWHWTGAGLFITAALLDRADGELARSTGHFSKAGHRLDLIADFGADALLFIAMGVGAYGGWLGWKAPLLSIAAAMGIASLFWQLNRPGQAPTHGPARLIDPDDMMLIVPVIACIAGVEPILLLAGTITPIVALWLIAGPNRARRQEARRRAIPRSAPHRSGIR